MTTRNTADDWAPCPPGMLRSIPTRSPESSRRKFLTGMAAGAFIGGLGLGTATWYQRSQPPGGLTCTECVDLFPAFARAVLQQRVSYRVEMHLAECPSCRRHYEEQYG